jgi:hypothetical protein
VVHGQTTELFLLCPLLYRLFTRRLQQLVYEKAMRLRIMMKMHGLSDGVYWLVTFCWYLVLSVVYFVLLLVFGSAIGLKFFTLNSYGTPSIRKCLLPIAIYAPM